MPTKFDVFAALVEHAPCKASELPFSTPVYMHLKALSNMKWINISGGIYRPLKNNETIPAFKIIRYCLKNGLDHNWFFSKNAALVISELFRNAPNLRPEKLRGNDDFTALLHYLEQNQFVLITKKRPRLGIALKHQLLDNVLTLNHSKDRAVSTPYIENRQELLKIFSDTNPFQDSLFSFLSGSAQLEGATITEGETKELILRDIYPDKPHKDIQMVKNLNEAMQYIFEHIQEDIMPSHIMDINKLVMFSLHRNAGRYKITENRIQGNPLFKTARPHEVPTLMDAYCQTVKGLNERNELLANMGFIHNELQRIHPFSDGNSRTTRIVVNWLLMKHRFPLLVIRMGCFDEYMSLTKLSNRREDAKLNRLFQHMLLHEELMR